MFSYVIYPLDIPEHFKNIRFTPPSFFCYFHIIIHPPFPNFTLLTLLPRVLLKDFKLRISTHPFFLILSTHYLEPYKTDDPMMPPSPTPLP